MWLKYGPLNPQNNQDFFFVVFYGQAKVSIREATWSVLTLKADYEPKTL